MDPDEEGEEFEEFVEPEEENEGEPEETSEEPEPEGEGDEPQDEPPARRPSRAQARIEALDRAVREANERAEAAERRVNEALNGTSRADAERREQERIAQMDPLERAEYVARTAEQRTNQRLDTIARQMADSTDRAEFAQACAANPALAKVKDQVEADLSKLRAGSNVNMPRATLAAYIIGLKVLEKAPKARGRAEKRGAANLDRERARPAGGSSDSPGRGRETSEKAARDKRLEDFTF